MPFLLRLIGKWESFATSDDIAVALKNGATIVDVREPHEFEVGHLENAINIPLYHISRVESAIADARSTSSTSRTSHNIVCSAG
ncbi:MAG: rhodanese-like domain-containing protein [Kofleriaceae bacterium]|nr:rhodanese-like domain-containing protein [Kofleriaceae bacterium]